MKKRKYLWIVIIVLIAGISIVAVNEMYLKQKLSDEKNDLQQRLENVEQQIIQTNAELTDKETALNENVSELQKLQLGSKYKMHDPTYQEVLFFIEDDETDKIPYDEETFSCKDYASIVNDNAESEGIRCCVVSLSFKESGHVLIGFDTIDKGMVYVEPQSDELVSRLEIGNEYWTECVIPKGGYYYTDQPDDTIENILMYW